MKFVLWGLLGMIAGGCAPLPTVKVSGVPVSRVEVAHAHKAKLLPAMEMTARPCEFLGVVSAIGDATSGRALRRMRTVAGRIGADALIAYCSSETPPLFSSSHRSWASAIAVKFIDPSSPRRITNGIGVVLIPRPQCGSNDTVVAIKLANAARYYLAEKGYYSRILDGDWPIESVNSNGQIHVSSLSAVELPDSNLVLLLRLKHIEGGLPRSDNGFLEAALLEKSSGITIWSFPLEPAKNLRLANFQDIDEVHGYHAILSNLFNTLPDRTTRVFFPL